MPGYTGDWENIVGTMQLETGNNQRSGSISRLYTHAREDTTEKEYIQFCKISKREK